MNTNTKKGAVRSRARLRRRGTNPGKKKERIPSLSIKEAVQRLRSGRDITIVGFLPAGGRYRHIIKGGGYMTSRLLIDILEHTRATSGAIFTVMQ